MDTRPPSDPLLGSKRAGSPRPPPAKRAKAAQACLSCRKYKTRCEILDGDPGAQCHRCRVLHMPCSFGDGSGPSVPPPSARAPPHPVVHKTEHRAPTASISDIHSYSPDTAPKRCDHSPAATPLAWGTVQPLYKTEDGSSPRTIFERHRPWGFSKMRGFEGVTVPMLAMQSMLRPGSTDDDMLRANVDQSLHRILDPGQLKYLTYIFEERYGPWMNLQPNYHSASPLVQLAQCCASSRHLDSPTRALLIPQLSCLADQVLVKLAFSPLPSTDAIYATLIHSLWGTVDDSPSRLSRDGRLLASTAVSMAMNLRLSEAMTYALALRNNTKPNESPSAELVEALDTARLWFALNSTETILCFGTGREPMADCSRLMLDAIATTSTSTISSARDMRLSLLNQLLTAAGEGLRLRLGSPAELGPFYSGVIGLLDRMEAVERVISPLLVLAEHEVFHFNILHVYSKTYRFLVLMYALLEAKRMFRDKGPVWHECVELSGIKPVSSWGSQALSSAEGVLTSLLSLTDLELLRAAPDHFFAMIALVSLFVILYNWSLLEDRTELLPACSDSLIMRTVEHLSQISCSPDHSAARCARVIEEGVASFRRKLANSPMPGQRQPSATTQSRGDVRGIGPSGVHPESAKGGMQAYAGQSVESEPMYMSVPVEEQGYFNSQFFFDDEFWMSFMSNLPQDEVSRLVR